MNRLAVPKKVQAGGHWVVSILTTELSTMSCFPSMDDPVNDFNNNIPMSG